MLKFMYDMENQIHLICYDETQTMQLDAITAYIFVLQKCIQFFVSLQPLKALIQIKSKTLANLRVRVSLSYPKA